MLSFARDPQGFINDWLQSQCRDLKVSPSVMTESSKLKALLSVTTDTMLLVLEEKKTCSIYGVYHSYC